MNESDKKMLAVKTIIEWQALGLGFQELVSIFEMMLASSVVTLTKSYDSEEIKHHIVKEYCMKLEKRILHELGKFK